VGLAAESDAKSEHRSMLRLNRAVATLGLPNYHIVFFKERFFEGLGMFNWG
jgi:hypothetical protein